MTEGRTVSFAELINNEKPVLVDFSAEWCGPCRLMGPILKELKQKVGNKAVIVKIDIDESRQAAEYYQIQSVPTLILFKKGDVLWRQSGVTPAHQLEDLINQHA